MSANIGERNHCKKCGLDILDTHYSDYFTCEHEWEQEFNLKWVNMTPTKEIFSIRLRYLRKATGLTQDELGALCGIPAASIAHFESLRSPRKPSFNNIINLCLALNISADYLLGIKD